ncbi:zinc finger CCCH domain-containing protein 8-like isoform X2 [Rutidosis leptorrhynchoides]|uniref:zinc finger CCCH domain-containing protein 8-like isoform X2 n=1 Tax=Rutidosis leptorrhynchoides TaxID=125765 RepID=UPI003A99AA5B
MANCGIEEIKNRFFYDLKRLFIGSKQVEVDAGDNVGTTESEQIDSSSVDSEKSVSDDRNMQHPIRPHAEDCSYFVRTGTCKFGPTCKFNHPVSIKTVVDGGNNKGKGVGSTSKGLSQIPCKFYQTGYCKNGESCKFNHCELEAENSPQMVLNAFGLPKRLGKTECSYYLRNGMCGFGVSCRFHHREPIVVRESEFYNPNYTCDPNYLYLLVPDMTPGSFVYVHQDGVVTGYQDYFEEPQCEQETNVENVEDYIVDSPKKETCVLNGVGLPIRPGKKACWNYMNLGLCKFGRACLYDHSKKCSSTDGSTKTHSP